jgi:DNA invertase Pin-like site-specific DNA recombinase
MSNPDSIHSKATTAHRAKLAYVYVRQSSVGQVMRHTESTSLQYELVERAVQLGWPRERVIVLDEDLGKSGTSAEQRLGFQALLAEIGLSRVGLVVSLDASRLARNNRDWYQLLELCSLFGTLIADGESLYDPRIYADRLLLGLSGMMSEAELHQLKLRLQAGARHKAERGELRQALPVGLTRQRDGSVSLSPDEEVQARLRLVFAKFTELGSARAVLAYLRRENLLLPSRPLLGPAPHMILWHAATNSAILEILKNPAYAGAYVYGRTTVDPVRRKPGRPHTGTIHLPIDKWAIVLQNIYPAYISWEEFLANQAQLQANQNHYEADKHGVPRKGRALLQGIVVCGRCGAHMRLRYSGPQGEFPVYVCNYAKSYEGGARCQEVRALGLDAEVEQLVLAALAPDQIAVALAALAQLEQEYAALSQQWHLRVERARYEMERARRQYDAVEPENRLVARTLERQWEDKLRMLEKVQVEYEAWQHQHHCELTPIEQQEILALGQDLPWLWHAPSTTAADQKRILRLVVKEVIVDQHRLRGKVWFQINWQTGATTVHEFTRCVFSYADYADQEALQQRLRELLTEQRLDVDIAAILNAEGFRTARNHLFTSKVLWLIRQQWGLPAAKINGAHPLQWDDGTYSVEGAAVTIGVTLGTIYKWLRCGRVEGHQLAKGTPWKIVLTDEQITSLCAYVQRVRRSKKEAS